MSAAIVGEKKEIAIFFHLHDGLHFKKYDSIDFLGPKEMIF